MMYSLLWLCTDGAAIRGTPNHDDFLTISHIDSVGAIPEMISTRFVDGLVIECGNRGKEVNGMTEPFLRKTEGSRSISPSEGILPIG